MASLPPTSTPPAPFGSVIVRNVVGLGIVAGLAVIAWGITRQVHTLKLPYGLPSQALEFPLWAILTGLLGNVTLKRVRVFEFVRPGFRTELFLKTGLVLLGAGLSFTLLAGAAGGALLQSLVLITSVFLFSWWLGGRFKLDDKLRAVLSAAVSICGVSAAIAAAGAVVAKKEQVSYVTALVIVVALPLMIIMPIAANWLGLPQAVAGAWFGGNIDTTAAVTAAGTLYGERAQQIATIVKTTQNALLGIVTFLLTAYFAAVIERQPGQGANPRLIWERFPKFVLGFVAASVLYSLGLIDGGRGTTIEALKNWALTMAFVSIGLEFSTAELRRLGWSPVIVFLGVTVFNTLLALAVAWLTFGVWWRLPGG